MKTMRRGTSILLCLALLVAAIPVILPVFTSATAADDQEEQLLGTLSQRFEASGPGVISSGSGDAGGKSYGAYQFSSRSDIPRAFFRWCQSSSDTYYRSIGNRLSAAYDADGGYGSNFDATWRALANEDSDGFLRVQRNYVRRSYYDPIVPCRAARSGRLLGLFQQRWTGRRHRRHYAGLRRSGRLCQSA